MQPTCPSSSPGPFPPPFSPLSVDSPVGLPNCMCIPASLLTRWVGAHPFHSHVLSTYYVMVTVNRHCRVQAEEK